jgi:aminotransferase
VTVGASGAFASTINALLDPGDGLLLFEPYYGYHLNAALVGGFEPRYLTLQPPGFTLREADLERAVDAKTRAVVICTPSNPSGKMYSGTELAALARVAEKHDLLVITDEIYEYIRYDGREHVSPASIPGLRDRTVSIMGLSKTFSITGWRLGYAVGPALLISAVTLVNDLYYVCAPTPLQLGAAAGFAADKAYFDEMQSS